VNKTTLTTLPAALALALTLGACGGGDDPGPGPGPGPGPQPQPVVGPFITDCFTVNKSVTFALASFNMPSNYVATNKSTIGLTTYNGEPVIGQTFFYPTGSTLYTVTNYWAVGSNDVTIIASMDSKGTVTSDKIIYPKDMLPEDTVMNASKTVYYKFVGFEKLILPKKTFSNSCHISATTADGTVAGEAWYAAGYGMIKQVESGTNATFQYDGDLPNP